MLFPALIPFLLFLLLSAFFSSAEFSRLPVHRGRMDNIEGVIHAKDIIPYIIDNKEVGIKTLLRKPLFVPESASLEKVHRRHISSLCIILREEGRGNG